MRHNRRDSGIPGRRGRDAEAPEDRELQLCPRKFEVIPNAGSASGEWFRLAVEREVPQYPVLALVTERWPWRRRARESRSLRRREDVVVTEKLDGGNTLLHAGKVYARSVSAPSEGKWMAMVKKHHAWKVNEPEVWLYGEDLYGVHSIEYEPVAEQATFYAFALRHGDGAFAPFAEVEAYAKRRGFRSCRCCSGGAFARLPGSGRSWSRPTVNRPCSGGSGRASSCGWREGLRRRSSRTTCARASVPDTCRATSTGPGIGDHAGSRRGRVTPPATL